MADPVDQASFAALVQRFSALVDQWRGIVSHVLVQEVPGAGPVALTDAAYGGKALLVGNGAATTAITLMLPADAAIGTLFLADQVGAGPLKLVPATGATLLHRLGHNGSAGQWASISAKCIRNPDGVSASWLVAGDTAVIA